MAYSYGPACTPCFRDDRDELAAVFCIGCNQNYCQSCVEYHDKIYGEYNHEMVRFGANNEPSAPPADFVESDVLGDRCLQHPTETLTMYCYPHDVVLCQSCLTSAHRDCIGVEFVNQACKGYILTDRSMEGKTQIENTLERLKRVRTLCLTKQEKVAAEKQRSLQEIRDYVQRMISRVQQMERQAVSEVQSRYLSVESNVSAELQSCDRVISSMEDLLKLRKDEKGDEVDLKTFIFDKARQPAVARANHMASALETKVGEERVQVDLNMHLEEDLKHMSIVSFPANREVGKILSPGQPVYYSQQFPSDAGQATPLLHPVVAKDMECQEYCIKVTNDVSTCTIKEICQLDSGQFVMVDYGNHNVKVFDNDLTFVSATPVGEWPSSVCQSGQSEVSIGMEYFTSGSIIQLSFENQNGKPVLVRKNKLKTRHYCLALTFGDDRYFVADLSGKIYTYDRNGNCLKMIYRGQTIKDIKLSRDLETIFVSDEIDGILFLDRLGKVKRTVKKHAIKKPSGLAADVDPSSLFVCDGKVKNVFHINQSGQMSSALLPFDASEEPKKPRSVCYDALRQRLLVSFTERDCITIIQLRR